MVLEHTISTDQFDAIHCRIKRNRSSTFKRAVDYAVTVPLAVLLLPLAALIYLTIRLVDRGPGLFVQEREGLDGRPFRFYKFRTMYTDADVRLQEHLDADPERRAEWEEIFKLDDDPRVLPWIGNLLRMTSLDELPNLWNILRGDMSLVGPRPFPTYHLDSFDGDFRRLRSSVRPGLTGLWQIGRGDLESQQSFDEQYIHQWSNAGDLRILVRTVPVVIFARKAHY